MPASRPAVLSILLVSAVFAVDLCLPLGVASAVPYTFAVLLALAARPRWLGPAIGGACGFLTVLKLLIVSDRGETELWKVLANRGLAVFAIGMTTALGLLRRRAEDAAREHQTALARVGRSAVLGQVAANLAHELNQPLAAVTLQSQLAARMPPGPELTATLNEIAEQATRAADVVRAVRRAARPVPPGREPFDLTDAVRTVVRLTDWHARRLGVTVTTVVATVPPVPGDRVQVEQILVNLVQNAIEAAAGGGRTVNVEVSPAGADVRVRVSDTGPGLADPAKLFDPYYTTKPDGTGLGLVVSRALAEAHGGRLTASPGPAGGAIFELILPAEGP